MPVELRLRIEASGQAENEVCAMEASVANGPFFRLHAGPGKLSDLKTLEHNAWAYGQWLGDWLSADIGLRGALEFAKGQSQGNVRMRLELAEECPSLFDVHWERLMYRSGGEISAVAADEKVFFARTVAQPVRAVQAGAGVFRLGLLIASPKELPQEEGSGMRAIDVNAETASLMEAWRPMVRAGQLRIEVAPEPTIQGLRRLAEECDGLHVICHGVFEKDKQTAALLLEKENGGADLVAEDRVLTSLASDRLRLLFLQSCESAQRGKGGDAWSGLAAKAARRIPVVVAMRERIRMDEAQEFAGAFYRSLLSSGEADRAANAGRRAIRKPGSGSWATPALFLDPRAPLWAPDPLRGAVHELARCFEKRREVQQPFPIEVIRAIDPDGMLQEEGPAGPRLPVLEAVEEALAADDRVCVLVGKYGRAKSAQLYRIYAELAARSAQDEAWGLPLFLRLRDFRDRDVDAPNAIADVVSRSFEDEKIGAPTLERIESQVRGAVTLLMDADDAIAGRTREAAFRYLGAILESNPAAKLVVVVDHGTFLNVRDQRNVFGKAAIFFVQLLTPSSLFQFLNSKAFGEKGAQLYNQISKSNLFDVASVPWLLGYLIQTPTFSQSRSEALTRIAESWLGSSSDASLQRLLREALSRIAFAMQKDKRTQMGFGQMQSILREVGEERDVKPEALRRAAIESRMLVRSEDDSVRFAYPGFQSYWCARHLVENATNRPRWIGDITASLGRLNRAKFWEDTLVILAGLLREPGELVGSILAGSSMSDGEQVHIACRAIHEARQANRAVPDLILRQVSANLIRQTRPGPNTEYVRRVRAVKSLGLLRDPDSVPHLLRLAAEKVRRNSRGEADYDLSGIRQEAIGALRTMQDETRAHIERLAGNDEEKEHAQALLRLMNAWREGDSKEMREISRQDDSVASVAFLLLGFTGGRENLEFLLDRLRAKETTKDSQWAITDSLLQFDPRDISRDALPVLREIHELRAHCIYLIGKLANARRGSAEVEFLETAIRQKDSRNRGMALRSMAQLGMEDYRDVCHRLAAGEFGPAEDRVEGLGEIDTERVARERLIRFALESLKLIGNRETIQVLEKQSWAKAKQPWSDSLVDLYFETSEEVYWRLTRGMEKDVLEIL
jgi:hypothetical protein